MPTATRAPANATELVDRLADVAARGRLEADATGRVPDEAISAARRAGAFRLLTPRELGGYEWPLAECLAVFESLGRIDGSFAWNVWNANIGFVGALLDEAGRAALWGDDQDPMIVNSARVTGHAVPTDGGLLLSGRWDLVSGILHADWVGLFAIVLEGGEPRLTAPGMPDVRVFFVPVDAIEVLDTWHVNGMRGTGSNTVVATNVFVPEALATSPMGTPHIDRPLYRIPPFTLASTGGAAVVAGMARAAIDAAIDLVGSKASDNGSPLSTRPRIRAAIARASTALRAGWLGLVDAARAIDEASVVGVVSPLHRATLRAAMCHVTEVATDVTTAMYRVGSSASLYEGQPLEQIFRDVNAAAQHGLLNVSLYETAGAVLLGAIPDTPMF